MVFGSPNTLVGVTKFVPRPARGLRPKNLPTLVTKKPSPFAEQMD